jgi:glycosyltransferase involved in cell wall biosynthesis
MTGGGFMTSANDSLKIAYILKMFPRLSETFILNEMLELERLGVDITIISLKKPNEGKFHPQLSNLKAPVYYLDDLDAKKWVPWLGEIWPRLEPHRENFWKLMEKVISHKDNKLMDYALYSAWAAAKIVELGIGHIHSHFGSLSSTIAYFAGRISSVPFSFTAHAKDIYVYDMEEHLLGEKLRAAKFAVTVTDYNKNYLHNQNPGLEPEKINVIYNGVALENIMYTQTEAREKDLILGVGRLVPKKGFDTLIDACDILKKRGVALRCVIAGNGSEAEMLFSKRSDLGLEDVIEFAGARRQDEIIDLMRRATMLCLPARIAEDGNRDALPTVLLEALASGLPVVSTDISGIPEIIDSGQSGILVNPDDAVSMADEIERFLNSEALRDRCSKAGLEKARKYFDIKNNVVILKNLFAESIKSESDKKAEKSIRPGAE